MEWIRKLKKHWKRPYTSALMYVIGLSAVIASSVILLHELGHVALGVFRGCDEISILIFDSETAATYTQMQCASPLNATETFFSSFLFVAPIAALFYSLKRFKERFMAHMVLGMGLISSSTELGLATGSGYTTWFSVAIGSITALYGAYRLIHGIIETEVLETEWRDRERGEHD